MEDDFIKLKQEYSTLEISFKEKSSEAIKLEQMKELFSLIIENNQSLTFVLNKMKKKDGASSMKVAAD